MFRYKPLRFEEELGNLFVGNSASGENAWVLTGDASISSEEPVQDYVDRYDQPEFMESFITTILLDTTNVADEIK